MNDGFFNGLFVVNIELTSRCQKKCFMCGRRRIERERPDLAVWGDIDISLVAKIAKQLPPDIVVVLHNNGEPTLYPELGKVISLFRNQMTQFNTNANLIVKKADEIINNLDILTISVIEQDEEANKQYETVKQFLKIKKDKKPLMVYRLLGNVSDSERWHSLEGTHCTRVLHSPLGSVDYKKKKPTVPEIGLCLDLMTHLSIDRFGFVSPCVRYDPLGELRLGNLSDHSLFDLWNSKKRIDMIKKFAEGKRKEISFCGNKCEFWGVPIGN